MSQRTSSRSFARSHSQRLRRQRRLAERTGLTVESLEERRLMAYDTVVLADAPVAYYRFEETSGTTVNDSATANGAQNGTIVGGVASVPGGTAALGNAFSFNGTSGRVRITDNPVFDMGTGPATIEMWFSATAGGARGDMLTYKGGGGDFGVHWQSNGAGRVSDYHGGFRVESTNNTADAMTNGISTGEWHHLVISRSGTGVNQTVMYIDGRAVSKGQDDQTFNIVNDILIGANHDGNPTNANSFFNGLIDEVAIYNTSLTEAQVQRHYDAGLGSYSGAVMENKPSVYYPFTSGAVDASGFARDGAVIGAVAFNATGNAGNGTAANFTGGYIQGPTATSLGMTNGSWTASAWIYPRSNAGDQSIFGNDGGTTDQTLHLVLRGGQLLMGFYADDLQTTASPPLNQWSHVVFRYDANLNAQSVFLNGQSVGVRIANADYSGTNQILIGRWGGGNAFDGLIDEAAIHPTALSPAEIAAMYRVGTQSYANPDTYSTTENANVNGNVLANDAGLAQPFTTTTTSTAGVSVTINPDGSFVYNPGSSFDFLKANETAIDTFLYSIRNLSNDNTSMTVTFANFGPGGSLNAYLYDGTARNWDEARARASTMSLLGVSGHLVTVESQAEENYIRANFPGNYFVGLSDSTGYSLLDGVRNSQADSGNSTTSPAWAWSNAAPYTYNAWPGSGEPNGGTGENSAQLRPDGLWNDLPSGDTIPGQGNNAQPSLIEFNLGEHNPGVAAPGLIMRQVRSTVGMGNTQAEAEALLAGANKLDEASRIYPFINVAGNGDGNIPNGMPFPFTGNSENFADVTTGSIFVSAAGNWTFNVVSDDGFELAFPGAGVTLVSTAGNTNNNVLGVDGVMRFEGGRGAGADSLGVFSFPSAGFYPIRLVHYEGGGGDSVELTAAQGSFNANNANFRLVGDTANGGLAAYTSLPVAGESVEVTINIAGENDVPVTGTVAAQTINEGSPVTFTIVGASDADAGETATLVYEWDIDGNGTFESVTNVPSITQTKAQLEALNIDGLTADGLPARTVNFRARDVTGLVSPTGSTQLIVRNVAPSNLMFDGPTSGGPNLQLDYLFSAVDVSGLDTAAGLTFDIDWGDGNFDSFGPTPGVTDGAASHTFVAEGTYDVVLTVTDRNGGESTLTVPVTISPVYVDDAGNLIINGSDAADRIILSFVSGGIQARINNKPYPPMAPDAGGEVRVFGYDGRDTITVSGSINFGVFVDGGDGADYITGGSGNDTLLGGAANDRVIGGGGDDLIYGGDGLEGPDGADSINGGNGNDTIYGEGGNDTINGDAHDDVIYGGEGADKIYGGAGLDQMFGDAGADRIDGGAGADLLTGGDGSDTLYGRDGNDVLIGGQSADQLFGGNGSDLVLGDDISDTMAIDDIYSMWMLQGLAAKNDIMSTYIDGGSVDEDGSSDTLYGDAGNDWFIAYGFDKIKDFKSGDAKTVNGV